MPTYQYACTACHDQFEVVQKFTDDALTECPHCGGRLRKVFSAVGVVFKGSGFYRTDSRGGSGATSTKNTGSGAPATADGGSAGSGASSTSDGASGGSAGAATKDSGSSGSSSSGSPAAGSSGTSSSAG